jgi:hypothetical protein
LKSAINKKSNKSSLISKLEINGKFVENPKGMANMFNEYFTSTPGKIVKDLHTVDSDTCPDFAKDFFTHLERNDDTVPCFRFDSIPIFHEEIVEATKALQPKTSLDHNGLSISLKKKCITILVTP